MATKAEGSLITHCLNKNHIIRDAIHRFPPLQTEAEGSLFYSMGKVILNEEKLPG